MRKTQIHLSERYPMILCGDVLHVSRFHRGAILRNLNPLSQLRAFNES